MDSFTFINEFVYKCLLDHDPDKIAIKSNKGSYTYSELKNNIIDAAISLRKKGFKQGDKICLLLEDSPEYIFIFWGALLGGMVPVLLNVNNKVSDIQYITEDCDAKVIIYENSTEKLYKNVELIHVIGENIRSFFENKEALSIENIYQADVDKLFILYTSGSTGRPKGVPHTIEDMEYCAKQYQKTELSFKNTDLIYSVSKIPFAFGFGNTMYLPFYADSTVYVSNKNEIFSIIDIVLKNRPSILLAVPTVFNNLLRILDNRYDEFENIRLTISCGEVLPKNVGKQWYKRFGTQLLEGMGTTEFLYTFLINTPQNNRLGSTGKPIPGYEVRVVDDKLKDLPINTVGQLFVKGNSLMGSYVSKDSIDNSLLIEGGMLTGDNFCKDADGYFWYQGRSLDTFKINGTWVRSEDIENELLKKIGILDVAVAGVTNNNETTKLIAYLVIDHDFNLHNVKRDLRNNLPHYMVPGIFYEVNKIPKGITGKIQRNSLNEGILKKIE